MNQEDTEVGGTGQKLALKCSVPISKLVLPLSVCVKTQATGAKAREKVVEKEI